LTNKKLARIAALVLLLGVWEWTAQAVFDRVCVQWKDRYLYVNMAVYRRALEDQKSGKQVYVGPGFAWTVINAVLFENHPVRILKPFNPLFIDSAEKPKDLVVYLMMTDPHEQDDALKQSVLKNFPQLQWETIRNPFDENESPLGVRGLIPFSDVSAFAQRYKKQGLAQRKGTIPPLFEMRPISRPYWDRRYFSRDNGLRPGLLDWEDKTPDVTASPASGVNLDNETVQYRGTIHVDKAGKFELACKTDNRTKVKMNDQLLFDMSFPRTNQFMNPGKTQTRTLVLERGDHRLEVLTCFQRSKAAPEITLHRQGSSAPAQSLWSSFVF
jgi:hypothetical protein